jgi:tetratricopeptide (TPR) repeat protein
MDLGLPEQAEEFLVEAIEILQEDGTMPETVVSAYRGLAKANIALNQPSSARHHLMQAHAIAHFLADETRLQAVNLELGQVCTDLGEYADAAKYLQAAIAEKGNPDRVKQSARASAAFARNLIASGDTDAGTAMLNELKPVLRALGIKE